MSITHHLIFLCFVVLATCTQNLTGFAFGLILLGLVGIFELVPMADAANAASILTLVNAYAYFRQLPSRSLQPMVWPTMASSLVGVTGGVALLGWLAANAVDWLRLLLGVAIVLCACMLLVHARPAAAVSRRTTFMFFGGLSGVMSGLFSSGGPPIVFHFYRQPLQHETIKQCLLLLFAANAIVRITLVGASGQFTLQALWLGLEALPVVYLVTRLQTRHPPNVSPERVRHVVSLLLLVAGGTLIVSVVMRLLGQG